jgi:hypothetical protein
VVWTIHGMIYRWRGIRTTDEAVEHPLAQVGEAIRAGFAWLLGQRRKRR